MGASGPSFSHRFPLSPLYFFPHHFPFPLCLFPSLEISLYFSLCPLLLLSSPETVDIRQLQHHSSQLVRPAPSGLQWLTLTGDKQRWERLASHCANLNVSLIAQLVKNPPAMEETLVQFLGWEVPWRRDRLPTLVFLGFPGGSDGKESTCNEGDPSSIPGLGSSLEKGTAAHSSILAWRIPWTVQSMASQRVGHD